MATIVVCDVCGNSPAYNKFEYKIHLDNMSCGYVDSEGNQVSGRNVEVDLCNKCYNNIVAPAVEVLKYKQSLRKDDV